MKSIPARSAICASARQSSQLADQRSGTLVAERPDEQLAPNMPIFSALLLYIARRSAIDPLRLGTLISGNSCPCVLGCLDDRPSTSQTAGGGACRRAVGA